MLPVPGPISSTTSVALMAAYTYFIHIKILRQFALTKL